MTSLQWIADWFASLSPEYAFLLALPFLVAIAGLLRGGTSARGIRTRARQEAKKNLGHHAHHPARPRLA